MNPTKYNRMKKWIERATWRFTGFPRNPNLFAIAGACIKPKKAAAGAAMKTVVKYASCCSELYRIHASVGGGSSAKYCCAIDNAFGNTSHDIGTSLSHWWVVNRKT